MSYYDREGATHIDGTRIFQTNQDVANEASVARQIEAAWGCEMRRFGALAAIDWYAVRDGRVVGLAELKTRSHASAKYPTVFLNVRKWLALSLASIGMGIPALFIVKFEDGLQVVAVKDIDASKNILSGLSRRMKSDNDIEPVIEVPIASMKVLSSK